MLLKRQQDNGKHEIDERPAVGGRITPGYGIVIFALVPEYHVFYRQVSENGMEAPEDERLP